MLPWNNFESKIIQAHTVYSVHLGFGPGLGLTRVIPESRQQYFILFCIHFFCFFFFCFFVPATNLWHVSDTFAMSIFLKQNVCRSPVSYIFYNFRRGQEKKEKEDLTAIRVCYIDTCIYIHTYIRLMALCHGGWRVWIWRWGAWGYLW